MSDTRPANFSSVWADLKGIRESILKRRNTPALPPYDLVPLGQIRNFSPVARRLNATIISGESTSASDISDEY
jgi:hypothetical protein